MKLPKISVEQNEIIKQLKLNNNIIVDSVAGSGKTTCNLHIARHFSDINILLLTYNSRLKLETREKVKKLDINNLEVHSYHSFCVKYYNKECYTDPIIKEIINNKTKQLHDFKYDLIVLDEAQDITNLYYDLICKIYKDNNLNAKICIFGDKNQCIFKFNGSDQRYIEIADLLFNFNSLNWVKCNLSVSFRVTKEMASFVNYLLKEERIISNKITKIKPRYIVCYSYGKQNGKKYTSFPLKEVEDYINLGYKPSDIFILAPSIKSNKTPIVMLENKIKETMPNCMVFVPNDDSSKLDEELIKGKLVISTFHQTKGLERKVVIIFGFDSTYFTFYNKEANRNICSNELYVSSTRSLERLTVIHDIDHEAFNFVNFSELNKYCNVIIETLQSPKYIIKCNSNDISVTGLLKYVNQNILDEFYNKLKITKDTSFSINKINVPLKVSNELTTESVSELNGIIIPSLFELSLKNKMSIYDEMETILDYFEKKYESKLRKKPYKLREILNNSTISINELLYLTNCWITYTDRYVFKLHQITEYNWLSKNKVNNCLDRMSYLNISSKSKFEYGIELSNREELMGKTLLGRIDCIDRKNKTVYEFKCVDKLEKIHYLQLGIYMYMYEINKLLIIKEAELDLKSETNKDNICKLEKKITEYKSKTKYVLYNILSNEYNSIECEFSDLVEVIKKIFYYKFTSKKYITDEEFVENNKQIYVSHFQEKR